MKKQIKRKSHKQDTELRKLKQENQRLKKEIRVLKEELAQGETLHASSSDDSVIALEKHAKNERLFSKKRYVSYVYHLIRNTSVFSLYSRMIRFVRRYTFLRTTLKIITAILAILETSTVFVLATSFFIVSLPFTILISYSALLFSFFRGRSVRKTVEGMVQNKKIVIFFPPKGYDKNSNSFFCGMAREEAKRDDHFCVIVSPYFFKGIGLDKSSQKRYWIARFETENILLIRRHYYFTLKKKVFADHSRSIIEIY